MGKNDYNLLIIGSFYSGTSDLIGLRLGEGHRPIGFRPIFFPFQNDFRPEFLLSNYPLIHQAHITLVTMDCNEYGI